MIVKCRKSPTIFLSSSRCWCYDFLLTYSSLRKEQVEAKRRGNKLKFGKINKSGKSFEQFESHFFRRVFFTNMFPLCIILRVVKIPKKSYIFDATLVFHSPKIICATFWRLHYGKTESIKTSNICKTYVSNVKRFLRIFTIQTMILWRPSAFSRLLLNHPWWIFILGMQKNVICWK